MPENMHTLSVRIDVDLWERIQELAPAIAEDEAIAAILANRTMKASAVVRMALALGVRELEDRYLLDHDPGPAPVKLTGRR